jgi:hypothetical protein
MEMIVRIWLVYKSIHVELLNKESNEEIRIHQLSYRLFHIQSHSKGHRVGVLWFSVNDNDVVDPSFRVPLF